MYSNMPADWDGDPNDPRFKKLVSYNTTHAIVNHMKTNQSSHIAASMIVLMPKKDWHLQHHQICQEIKNTCIAHQIQTINSLDVATQNLTQLKFNLIKLDDVDWINDDIFECVVTDNRALAIYSQSMPMDLLRLNRITFKRYDEIIERRYTFIQHYLKQYGDNTVAAKFNIIYK